MGILKINGTIELDQFWPIGKSDADTTKIIVKPHSFAYKSDSDINFKETDIFQNAKVKGDEGLTNVVKYKNTSHSHINIRLQGIDAPELHYKLYGGIPKGHLSDEEYKRLKKVNSENEFRQYFAETATYELQKMLKSNSKDGKSIDCIFISESIDKPSDICDVYGRFVGDILTTDKSNRTIDVNHWLLENGWVFPAFYNSLTHNEISDLLNIYKNGQSIPGHTLQYYTSEIKTFDVDLQFRDPKENPVYNATKDKGKVILPKFFRRWSIYQLYQLAKIDIGTFQEYLQSKKDDQLILRLDLNNYRKTQKGSIPLSQIFDGNNVIVKPEDMIFIEKPSMLLDESGNEIMSF
jgi:Micrococcal nuclease (thermonuclease) homologs